MEVGVESERVPHPVLPHQRETRGVNKTEGVVREALKNFILKRGFFVKYFHMLFQICRIYFSAGKKQYFFLLF